MEVIRFSEMSVLTRTTQCYIPENGILLNLHSVFGDFFNGKKLVRGSNLLLAHWATE
jgi:hypothetical protein